MSLCHVLVGIMQGICGVPHLENISIAMSRAETFGVPWVNPLILDAHAVDELIFYLLARYVKSDPPKVSFIVASMSKAVFFESEVDRYCIQESQAQLARPPLKT